jgi:hypothetical protein
MQENLLTTCTAGITFLALVLLCAAPVHAQGDSPSRAAPPGKTVSGIIECGTTYNSHELYNVRVTLQEIIRGDAVLAQLPTTGNIPVPAADTDYLLARVSFNYKARGRPGNCIHQLRPAQFKALSDAGVKYDSAELTLPDPALGGAIKSGETLEGWLAFQVPKGDTTPLLSFSVDETGGVSHGGNLWFRLY